jgi:N-acetylglucosamine-6-phosphate deacetylase
VIPAIQTAYRRAYPSILGYHLEGPFLSGKKPGCHPPENLRCAEEGWNTMLEMYGNGPMGVDETSENDQKINQMAKIVTVAPELMGGTQTINKLKHAGFVVSIGHS